MVLPFLETFAGGGYWRQYCPESQSDWATPGASSMKISCAGMTELRGPTWPPGSNARPGPLIGPSLGLFNSHVYIHLGILWVIVDHRLQNRPGKLCCLRAQIWVPPRCGSKSEEQPSRRILSQR